VRTLFVIDAMIGQEAVNVAKAFQDQVGFDGVILSKLDGDARGGAALSVREVTGTPIMFASVGEGMEDFEAFHPDRMAGRILGMGDVMSLIEKAEATYTEEEAAKAEQACSRATSPSRTSSSSCRCSSAWGRCRACSGCCRA
jgi:signal recognition particle subunit SRP54